MKNCIEFKNNIAYISLCSKTYEKDAVLASAYLISDDYCVEIKDTKSTYAVKITNKKVAPISIEVVHSFIDNCIDEQLRLLLEKRTGRIRELIVEHAFKPLDLISALESINVR